MIRMTPLDAPKPEVVGERRDEARKSMRVRVSLSAPGRPMLEARGLEIGLSGMSLVAEANPAINALFTLGFTLLFADRSTLVVQISGSVAYCVFSSAHRGFKVGLNFKGAPPQVVAALERYMKE